MQRTGLKSFPNAPDFGPHIGVDEAGRGCLAGPVVAGAVIFGPDFPFADILQGLDDSKKLTPDKRGDLAPLIREHALAWGIGFAWQDEIDAVNILNATFRAMSRAVLALRRRLPPVGAGFGVFHPAGSQPHTGQSVCALPLLLIDGNQTIPGPQWALATAPPCPKYAADTLAALDREWEAGLLSPPCPEETHIPLPRQQAMVKGDSRAPSIAAASILAKTARDTIMERLESAFPGYGFAEHKGYGTAAHLAALDLNGPCALHRKTFRKVRTEERQLMLL